MPTRASFLPGLEPAEFTALPFGEDQDRITIEAPVATTGLLASAIERITASRDDYLANLPMARIIEAIDSAISCWLDPSYHLRRIAEELLPAVTGYSRPMISVGLPRLLEPFRAEGLRALVRAELGEPPALEAPRQAGAGPRMVGPRLTTHILAGNIPAVPAESIIHALLVKSASLVKPSSGDPLFPALFAQSLAEMDPRLGQCIAVLWWKGGDTGLERQAFEASDAVIAYGGDRAIDALRRQAPPTARFIAYGPRMSFAMIGRESLDSVGIDSLAARAAWDSSFFDQQGCVSPHAIFVERGGRSTPLDFADALAKQMEVLETRLPRGRLRTEEASAIQQLRATWELRRAAGRQVALFKSWASTAWTVLYEEGAAPAPSCLNRVVRVVAVDDLAALPSGLRPLRRYLQTIGMAVAHDRLDGLARALAECGVTRICPLGRMQHPPAAWHHDGRPSLLELIRCVDMEHGGHEKGPGTCPA